jgi:hypothetical protein
MEKYLEIESLRRLGQMDTELENVGGVHKSRSLTLTHFSVARAQSSA